jgi:hypothetical protein
MADSTEKSFVERHPGFGWKWLLTWAAATYVFYRFGPGFPDDPDETLFGFKQD